MIVKVSNFEENLSEDLPLKDFVVGTAKGKLETTIEEMKKSQVF